LIDMSDDLGDLAGAIPLSLWERIIAMTVGGVLLVVGGFAVFGSTNQAGSVVLLLVGAAFALFGINGMPLIAAKVKDFELQMPARLRRAVRDLAAHLPHDEARLVLSTIEQASATTYPERVITLIDVLLFEARVRDAAIQTGERVVPRISPGIGDPLLDIVLSNDVRIGIFAMFAPTEHGSLTPEFTEAFLAQLPAADVQGILLVTCVPDSGDLAALAKRASVPAVAVRTGPTGEIPPLGPFLDRFRSSVPGR
jgi:hypothetical protein